MTEEMFGAVAEECPRKGMCEVTLSPSVLQNQDGCFSADRLAKSQERRKARGSSEK